MSFGAAIEKPFLWLAPEETAKEVALPLTLLVRFGPMLSLVVLGLNEPANLRILATTVKEGDPGYAGALAGVALGIPSYHIIELKDEIPPKVWQEQMAMKELEMGDDLMARIRQTLREVRGG